MSTKNVTKIASDSIEEKILTIRGQRVMLDFELAQLYEVETRALKQAVKRNIDRFPEDFMLEVTKEEWKQLITNCDNFPERHKHNPVPPYAFTEYGIVMLSSVLRSTKAVEVNIQITRAFIKLRRFASLHEELAKELKDIRTAVKGNTNDIKVKDNTNGQRENMLFDKPIQGLCRTDIGKHKRF
ncbi:MAG: hypothetical protein ACD_39C02087G0006 [uncultured bacterium]|nr:MAG: hypothetical protein ACD_39C02087G0006 [uncultured bacterium]